MGLSSANRVRVVGCGRWLRRDDQVGLLVVEAIAQRGCMPAGVALTQAPGAELADEMIDCDALILVDAAAADANHPPGTWQAIDYRAAPTRLRPRSAGDTHTLGVDSALRLAATLGSLPEIVRIYAISAADTSQGDELTPQVSAAMPQVIEAIANEVRTLELAQAMCEEPTHA